MSSGNGTLQMAYGRLPVPDIHTPPAPSLQALLLDDGPSQSNGVMVMKGGFSVIVICRDENNPTLPGMPKDACWSLLQNSQRAHILSLCLASFMILGPDHCGLQLPVE
eukprot:9580001-Ditylum_brightwellii.AAC.1